MGHHTALYAEHQALNARLVDFGGWDMPVQYTSVLDEHHAVRRNAGMFDVSHMTFLEVTGPDACAYLRYLLANDVARLPHTGRALYSAMLKEDGGILDDLIVYAPTTAQPDCWRVVVNCGTRAKDVAWMQRCAANFRVSLKEREDLSMIAVQGPQARATVAAVKPALAALMNDLDNFQGGDAGTWFVARTGYTGEDGCEILLPHADAPGLWRELLSAGVMACGLGARDTLRLEAGMNLYGNDMNESTSPLVANMAWTVAWDHDFIGKQALLDEKNAGVKSKLVGLILEGKGVLRAHMRVLSLSGEGAEGETTSGTFSPTLERAIALARLPVELAAQEKVNVEIRGKLFLARVVKPPFARNGAALF